VIGGIEKSVDLCDSHSLFGLCHLYDFVTRSYIAFAKDTEVETWSPLGREQCRHHRL
jgi:hypothetical protein